MKKFIGLNCICLLLTVFTTPVFSQGDIADATADENYIKSNIGLTKFMGLGVNRKQYAKCLKAENFLEPDRTLKLLEVDKITYMDDGNGYDLKAGDGILTSTELFTYTQGTPIETGMYKESEEYNNVVADASFEHYSVLGTTNRFGIDCKFRFIPCNELTPPARAALCNWAGWPYRELHIYDCHISFTW